MEASEDDSATPWRWILEHLVDMKDIGTPMLREILTYIPNVMLYNRLQKRVAVRYLEEAIAGERIDAQVVPLLECLLKESQSTSNYPTTADYKALLLRVEVEAVIVHIRTKPSDWHRFSQALDHYFSEDSKEAQHLEKRKELVTLLQAQGPDRKCAEVLETYSLTTLRGELLKCISFEKRHLEQTFLEKLLQDVCDGKYLLPVCKPVPDKKVTQKNILSADGHRNSVSSDAQTVMCGRISHANSEEAIDTNHKELGSTKMQRESAAGGVCATSKRSSIQKPTQDSRPTKRVSCEPEQRFVCLRDRDGQGKAVTSHSPEKDVRAFHDSALKGVRESNGRPLSSEGILREVEEGASVGFELLEIGSDGHEEVCHVCKEGGRLICCDGCPVAVHRRCLVLESSSVKEDWFCPWCVQKKAAGAVAKAREEELAARERLMRFMADSHDKCALPVSRGISEARKVSRSMAQGRKAVLDTRKQLLDGPHGDVFGVGDEGKETSCLHTKKEATIPSANGCQKPSLAPDYSRGSDGDGVGGLDNTKGKKKEQPRRQEDMHTERDDGDGDVGAINVASLFKAHESIPQDNMNAGDGDGHDGDLEEDYEGRKSSVLKPNKFRGNRIVLGLRRKRLLWSKEEEDTLKEGVTRFSRDNGGWGFQWKRILEFGKGRFDPSRTDVDLKDKWRNLAKRLN